MGEKITRTKIILAKAPGMTHASTLDIQGWVTASAAAGLFALATVQIAREWLATTRRLRGARLNLEGAAWLARRQCEEAIRSSEREPEPITWANRVSGGFDRLQGYSRDVLLYAGQAKKSDVEAARCALEAFLAAADIINPLAVQDKKTATLEERKAQVTEATSHLYQAVTALESFAARREHEPEVHLPVSAKS